jgi:hypothetical protein
MRIKNNIFPQIIWNIMKYFLYLQRQKVAFGYPGKFPARGKPLSTLPNFTNANHAIGYAAECGEQDFIDTTPLFFCQRFFLTIRVSFPRGSKTLSTLLQEKG